MYQWISELVRHQPEQTTERAWSAIGQAVRERYQCGQHRNNKLHFTSQDKFALRSDIKKELGIDPFETRQLPASRLQVAEYHDNEKLAKNPASHDHVLVNSPSGMLNLNGRHIQLHTDVVPAAGMLCLSSEIKHIDHSAIVVVENLSIMACCNTLKIPAQINSALWIYRGDYKSGAKIDACHALLNRFGNDKEIIVFSDMDPKGLEIALTIGNARYWLGPEASTWSTCLKSKVASPSGYDSQGVAMNYLLKQRDAGYLSEPFNELISLLNTKRSSYRQEHSYAHNIPLALFSIKRPQN
jgi:hypothetical protein